MKKLFLSLLSLIVAMTIFAQSNVRKMNLIYDGQVVYSRYVSLIDSIKFVLDENAGSGDDDITGGEVDPTKQLYVGVVAFNRDVRQMAITSDMDAVKAFINEQTNDKDFTAFAYSVSKGNKQFDAPELPDFYHVFMLNFSDGTDNYSNMKWGEEGRIVNNNFAYDTARYDLSSRVGLNSYAIGFGAKEADFREKMKKIVMGSGSYYAAASSNDLQPTFNEIAKSMLASAKNVLLKTNPGYYVGFYKYFRLSFVAEDGSTDHIYAQMDGTPTTGYTLSISKTDNGYAYFDAPAKGVVDDETGKVHIPLNNLKFVKGGKDLQYKFTIEVSFDGESYYEDVEEASTAEEISKRIAVVLVLDCSTSMGDAFAPMKAAAVDFIKTMEKNGHEYVDLGLSVKWATCNVGASKPEDYGDYFAWGETQPNEVYGWSTYKWCNGRAAALTKYNYSSYWGNLDNKTQLELSDDAARANWGGSWRMPTDAELIELFEQCTWTWTIQNGKYGYKVTSKSNGNSIFLPAAGYREDGSLYNAGSCGYYWSSSISTDRPDCAYTLGFCSDTVLRFDNARDEGFSVRPVCP